MSIDIPKCPRGENHIIGYGATNGGKYHIGCASCSYGYVEEDTQEMAIKEFKILGARKKLKELLFFGDKPTT